MEDFVMNTSKEDFFTDEQFEMFEEKFGFEVADCDRIAFSIFVNTISGTEVNEDTYDTFQEAFLGVYNSPGDYVYEYYREQGKLDELDAAVKGITNYLPWDKIAHDWGISDVNFVEYGFNQYYVFDNHCW